MAYINADAALPTATRLQKERIESYGYHVSVARNREVYSLLITHETTIATVHYKHLNSNQLLHILTGYAAALMMDKSRQAPTIVPRWTIENTEQADDRFNCGKESIRKSVL